METPLLTIITPTYNRAHTLPACYESLCGQTNKGFMWMVIDDGSSDHSEELVSSWIEERKILISYRKKENGGKASALNMAMDLLDTQYAVCLDSDDTFYPQTVEFALKNLDEIKDDEKCCGILALRNNPDGSVMGGKSIPENVKQATAADIFMKYRLTGELICFYKTKILKKFRFPEFEGEKFVSPAWMQYQVTQDYSFAISRDRLCCCEYIADGLTKNKRKIIVKNPKGYTCVKRWSFDLAPTVPLRIKHGIMYDCGCILGKDINWFKNARHKAWAVALMPAAYFVTLIRFRNHTPQ